MFSRVAIVNRGEAAMRLIHAVRDLSAETGIPVETVALYTDADRTATFVREADLAYPLGPASARPGPPGTRASVTGCTREWRNRQTRTVQVRVPERV